MNSVCAWQGKIDESIATCSEYPAAANETYRIVLDEDKALFIEKQSQDHMGQPAWIEVTSLPNNCPQQENAILTQALYSLVEILAKQKQHLQAMSGGLKSCVFSMEMEAQNGARQLLTVRNAKRLIDELHQAGLE